ncbi:roadblock/LC7 domain-containing protein [Citrobacter braakii]|uniref:roadblock/LC7 domain-containing protein n=1 Tax=Citrobacter braakii TaxID=57706 RepID=UPI000DF0EA64|nr:hypothetical protein [Citrobacter braakii]WAD29372.1 hypothetical protein MKJ05_14015 [Citrobacter braakii]STB68128.1 Uncharacterised protein [Citrobacter freundii]SUX75914.1 Uncharacterised protein [Citrobacter freundii]
MKNGLPFPLKFTVSSDKDKSASVEDHPEQVIEPEVVLQPLDEKQEKISDNDKGFVDSALKEKIDKALNNYVNKFPDIQNLVLSTVDGFEISSVLDQGGEDIIRKVSAMSSSLQSIGSAILREIGAPGYQYLYLNNGKRSVFIYLISGNQLDVVLMAVSGEIDSLGQALWMMQKLVDEVKELIQ